MITHYFRLFESVLTELKEPPRSYFFNFAQNETHSRDVAMVLLDRKEEKMYEVEVSLSKNEVIKVRHIPNTQPALMASEYPEVEKMLKAHPMFQESLRKRGIVDLENVAIDVWTVGWFSEEDNPTRRFLSV
jgi:primary-amine oxidase